MYQEKRGIETSQPCELSPMGGSYTLASVLETAQPSRRINVTLALRLSLCFVAFIGLLAGELRPSVGAQAPANPTLINTCLITDNIDQLVTFYEKVLGIKAQRAGTEYAEFHTGVGVLAIFSGKAQQAFIPGSAEAGKNRVPF